MFIDVHKCWHMQQSEKKGNANNQSWLCCEKKEMAYSKLKMIAVQCAYFPRKKKKEFYGFDDYYFD